MATELMKLCGIHGGHDLPHVHGLLVAELYQTGKEPKYGADLPSPKGVPDVFCQVPRDMFK